MKIVFTLLLSLLFISLKAQTTNDRHYFGTLPPLLTTNTGKQITNFKQWEKKRRPEILQLLEEHVYGFVPEEKLTVSFEVTRVTPNALCGKAIQKDVEITFSNGKDSIKVDLLVLTPTSSKQPVPLFLGMNFYGNHTIHRDDNIPVHQGFNHRKPQYNIFTNTGTAASRGVRAYRWPVETILERGYGLATIAYGSLDPDYHDEFHNGIHALIDSTLYNKKQQPSAISAWTYGLRKAMDYLVTDKNIDAQKVIVMGHSRLGKTALWAGATDPRFAMVISNNSGCGGAALSRRTVGESVNQINHSFPHWFAENFHQYNEQEDKLPVDQHMLMGLIAPRPIYVASAQQDTNADPKGEFLSLYYASPAYELYKKGVIAQDTLPDLNMPLWSGNMAYHIRSGKHDVTIFDWTQYMNFADRTL